MEPIISVEHKETDSGWMVCCYISLLDSEGNVDSYIKERVKEHWKAAVDALVAEALNDSKALREKIAAELEKKLRAQLAAALKNAA